MQNFNNLVVYQKAFGLSKAIYATIGNSRQYRLRDQLLGSSTSICANLAEMSSFDNLNQIKQKLKICIGESNETEFWLTFLKELGLISISKSELFLEQLIEIRKMLYAYLKNTPS